MAMTACYPNYDLSGSQGMTQLHHHQSHHSAIQSNRLSSSANTSVAHQQQQSPQQQKDYSIPLHVDCSVEYELPNQAKPPVGSRVEPLLMIHPCYFRKMESQRRSPFVNNMPNTSTRSSSSSLSNLSTTVASSSATTSASSTVLANSRRNNAVNSSTSSISNSSKNSNSHMLSGGVVSHQSHIQLQQPSQVQQQQISHHHHLHQQAQQTQAIQPAMPNLQQQLDEYMQRQMVHMSQQAQYPVGANIQHSSNQYMQHASNQGQHSHQQMATAANWDRYMTVSSNASDMLARVPTGKVNIPNQAAYKKSGKRSSNMLSATCANSYSSNALEGGLPNNVGRWDMEKASMAAIPRDYQAGPESLPPAIQQQQPQAHKASAMYRTNQVGKRDAMLSGGSCTMYNSNTTNTDISTSGLWDPIEKSPMATIPSNYQAGPDSIPNTHSSSSQSKPAMVSSNSSNMNRRASGATTLSYHHHQPLQQAPQQEQLIHHQLASDKLNVGGKYRQYLRSHRLHPYMMTGNMPGVAQSMSAASQFPHLNGNVFPQIQQVSCYNV